MYRRNKKPYIISAGRVIIILWETGDGSLSPPEEKRYSNRNDDDI